MKNQEVADLLNRIADVLEILEEQFKPQAYRRAAQVVETLSHNIEDFKDTKALTELPAIGLGIAEKIHEYLETGKSAYYDTLKKKIPVDIDELLNIEGIGPKKIKVLYKKLKITNRSQLESAAKEHKIQKLEGFGAKSEQAILDAIGFSKESGNRMLLSVAWQHADEIVDSLKRKKCVELIEVAGSIRRRKETIGDIDILAVSKKPEDAMNIFTQLPDVKKVLAHGETKSSIMLNDGVQVDLRIVEKNSWGSALNYFTGSKNHNIALRQLAIKKTWKLSEWGLFDKSEKQIAGKTEEELYKKLGLKYIEPELREMTGELEASQKNKLPNLISLNDIKSDFQMHSTWSDGANSIAEMANAAHALGYHSIAITDHVGSLVVAGSMNKARILQQWKEIDKLNKTSPIQILKGAEVNIKADGSLDLEASLLPGFDVVLISLHSALKQPRATMMARLEKAFSHDHVHIFAHPSGRQINERPGADFDYQKLFDFAKQHNIILEINAQPKRLDLADIHAKAAIEASCTLSIGTDSHTADSLQLMKYGVSVARRAWAEKENIINTFTTKKLNKVFNISG